MPFIQSVTRRFRPSRLGSALRTAADSSGVTRSTGIAETNQSASIVVGPLASWRGRR